ncbi:MULTISPECIES: TylF/MycF family methyltransferase [Bacillus]|uniref:Macrocin O-methyltransferase n=1 Tax=Bacillus glycinifermentans TaxID=1664069 RepID=A0AAJ4D2X6_9BACI|nr:MULTISPECIES: TylF/MycF family methyltransferase [Bacillus]KKB74673.1 macrocin-O-methyltransferase [Bacillus sp. TH008]MDU0070976.1 TylF/MycF family methyltransferase [Bacillus sp. IG6]MED8018843.1 TylF/MycF family methyltransferase [Bacillus glycinifermentans]QAT65908.1 macrocin O-methyltransferase [Bacillus glycinifermentans]WKB75610.1 TylF/MycF family methyltransferase [Bacillus glycinifermentans]
MDQAKQMYLELLKKTVLFEIWQEHERYIPIGVPVPESLQKETGLNDLKIVRCVVPNPELRRTGTDWPPIAHSMIGRVRMNHLQMCMETVLQENIAGDFIETGVWRGGACIFMKGFLKVHGEDGRTVWVADSFEGLPAPDIEKYPQDTGDRHHEVDFLRVSLEEVRRNFEKYDLLDENVQFLKGWFKDTLPEAPIERLAILRLDGDMYESTMDSLANLYGKVSKGGFVIIDDFSLKGCHAAVLDFLKEQGLDESILVSIDPYSVYWRKP